MAKAGEGNGGARSRPVSKRLIQANATQDDSGGDVAHQNAGRGKFCAIDKKLSNDTKNSAAKKSAWIYQAHPSFEMATASLMPGMDSPCAAAVGE